MDSGNTWLAVLAVATAVQATVVVGVLIVLARNVQRMNAQVARLEREHLQPLVGRIHAIADDVQDGIGRLRTADDEIREAVARSFDGASQVAHAAQSRMWPAVGVVRGAAAVLKFFASDRRRLPAVDRYPKGVHHVRQ